LIREIVVISGKGGTGKTSLAASFAVLAGKSVVADCDVDAADLHLLLQPRVVETHPFWSGREAVIRRADCRRCGICYEACRFGAVKDERRSVDMPSFAIDPLSCEGCGVCVRLCPERAIEFPERLCGEWMVSETRCGPMVHARLAAAAENSGKLVSTVRRTARRIAEERGLPLIIVDGPPGIACPVIASMTGASSVVAIAEPTVSGEHDLERILALARHFDIPASVCVNKWDINREQTERIEEGAARAGARLVGRIPYDPAVTRAQVEARTVIEAGGPAAEEIARIWEKIVSGGSDGTGRKLVVLGEGA